MKLYQKISQLINARNNCIKSDNTYWRDLHTEHLHRIADYDLPHGSGIDRGGKIDLDRSNDSKIVITFGYHAMDENGYYCGWYDYTAVIKPAFDGITIRIMGSNTKNDAREYLYQLFYEVLNEDV
jgi:hypothetical protein